jgi:hypothetical protein
MSFGWRLRGALPAGLPEAQATLVSFPIRNTVKTAAKPTPAHIANTPVRSLATLLPLVPRMNLAVRLWIRLVLAAT